MTDGYGKTSPANLALLAKADPAEPVFVLLGRDPAMTAAIDAWIAERTRLRQAGLIPDTVDEAVHLEAVAGIAYAVGQWQARQSQQGKQAAYAAARAAHVARYAADPDAPDWAAS